MIYSPQDNPQSTDECQDLEKTTSCTPITDVTLVMMMMLSTLTTNAEFPRMTTWSMPITNVCSVPMR